MAKSYTERQIRVKRSMRLVANFEYKQQSGEDDYSRYLRQLARIFRRGIFFRPCWP
jgi:hypothetical protein